MVQIQESLRSDVLTIGFARRFATYKRAYLLLTNLDRLDRIVNNPQHPVQFLFAGKAHPNDKPGQDLIKRIVEVAAMPRFIGKVIFLQNYDMELAGKMVQGVDVWLNTPTRPLEASGTSGEKAVMNGVLNFSVLDGWWVEGYKEGAGWALPQERTFEDQRYQDDMDAEMIYNTIEEEIVPKYYNRGADNIPYEWVRSIKLCIADIASNFTTNRMLTDYENQFYGKLFERGGAMKKDGFAMAREMAAWKRNVSRVWDQVKVLEVQNLDIGKQAIKTGGHFYIEVKVDVSTLHPEDIGVEMVVAEQITEGRVKIHSKRQFDVKSIEGSVVTYMLDAVTENTGTYDAAIRLFAQNPKLPHRMDFALVKWA
jgi:phosphorylase/glycogen(starch) synthase